MKYLHWHTVMTSSCPLPCLLGSSDAAALPCLLPLASLLSHFIHDNIDLGREVYKNNITLCILHELFHTLTVHGTVPMSLITP